MLDILLYSSISGILGTALGALVVVIAGKSSEKLISYLLGMAAGMMIAISVFTLMPHAVQELTVVDYNTRLVAVLVSLFVVLGFAMIFGLDKVAGLAMKKPKTIMLSHGDTTNGVLDTNKRLKTGIIIFIAMILHNFPEGLVIGAGGAYEASLGLTLAIVLGVQNIPEGMATAAPLLAGGLSKNKVFWLSIVSAIPIVVSAVVGYWIGGVNVLMLAFSLGAAAGALLYVVFVDMIPECMEMTKNRSVMGVILAGVLLGYLFNLI